MELENQLAKKADKVLLCDTDLLETKVYSEEYYGGFVNPNLETAAIAYTYDLYLLTYIDIYQLQCDSQNRPVITGYGDNGFFVARCVLEEIEVQTISTEFLIISALLLNEYRKICFCAGNIFVTIK